MGKVKVCMLIEWKDCDRFKERLFQMRLNIVKLLVLLFIRIKNAGHTMPGIFR
jgi:hypothetical protein